MTTEPKNESATLAEISRIKSRISSVIEEHFSSGTGHLFLAALGTKLGADLRPLEKLTGMKLSEFVRSSFSYEIGVTGEHKNILYLVAPGKSAETINQPPPPTPRYLPKFWAAFAIPLADAQERHIDLETLRFGPDATELKTAASDVRRIDAKYIAPRDASGSASGTAARIAAWLDEQHLKNDRFLDARKRPRETETLLDALLSALDGDELKRVSLPLDIVKALAERRR